MLEIALLHLKMTMVINALIQAFNSIRINSLSLKTVVRCAACPLPTPNSLSRKGHVRHRKGLSMLTMNTSLEYDLINKI